MLSLVIILAVIVLILGWIANRIRTRQMRKALGREVRREELTSLNSWMEASPAEDARKREDQ
jgi:lipopolysaccharide biosynthesis regulator YciM